MTTLGETSLIASSAMPEFNLRALVDGLGPVGWVVVGILLLMSMWSFGVTLDRALMYAAVRRQSRVFVHQVAGALRDGKLDEAFRIAERNKRSHIAQVTATGLAEFQSASPRMSADRRLESARRSLERSTAIVHAELERGLSSLATIGSTAPFVGLFGTVWGIMNSFIGISKAQTTNLAVVAPGIAEALLATAIGLFAAIPAVIVYNQFARWIGGYRGLLGDGGAEVLRLVSRDLDKGLGAGSTRRELPRAAE